MIDERFVASLAKTALLTPAEKVSRVMLIFTLTCWWSSGHQIIARIAEQMLTRHQLSYLSSIFAEWPDESGSIMDISTWQDRIKDDAEIRTMSAWHFVDLPIIDPKFVPTSIRTFYNVTSAIHDSFETLMNPSTTSRWAISFSLRNLIHFVGDVHQPLHASGFFSADYPTGDAGGNHFKVSCAHGAACANMHALWDSGLLKYQFDHFSHFLDEFESNVSYITKNYQPPGCSNDYATTDPNVMAAEAQDIAKEIAYGTLREDRQVDDGYLAANRLYVDLQLSLAGYRLGNMLQMFFDRGSARIGFSLAEAIVWGINAVAFVIIVVYLTVLRQVRPRTR